MILLLISSIRRTYTRTKIVDKKIPSGVGDATKNWLDKTTSRLFIVLFHKILHKPWIIILQRYNMSKSPQYYTFHSALYNHIKKKYERILLTNSLK